MSLWLLGRLKGNQGGRYRTLWYPADVKWQLARQMAYSANIDGNYKVIIQHRCHMENKQTAIHLVLHLETDEQLRCHLQSWPERETVRVMEPFPEKPVSWKTSQKNKKRGNKWSVYSILGPYLHFMPGQKDESGMLSRFFPDGQIIHGSLKIPPQWEDTGCAVTLTTGS